MWWYMTKEMNNDSQSCNGIWSNECIHFIMNMKWFICSGFANIMFIMHEPLWNIMKMNVFQYVFALVCVAFYHIQKPKLIYLKETIACAFVVRPINAVKYTNHLVLAATVTKWDWIHLKNMFINCRCLFAWFLVIFGRRSSLFL